MTNITLSIDNDLKKKMNRHKEINWSEIARQAIQKRVLLLEELNELLSKSEITEEDAIKLGREVNKKVYEKYYKRK